MDPMVTINKLIMLLLLGVFISGCAGNYKTSDDRYRPVGQPPIVIDNKTK